MNFSTIHARCSLVPSGDYARLLASARAPRTAAHFSTCTAACSTSQPLSPLSSRLVAPEYSNCRQNGRRVSRGFKDTARSAALSEAVAEAAAVFPEARSDVLHHDGSPAQAMDGGQPPAADREWLPEEFELEAGAMSTVHREGLNNPADVFRCSGCSLPECQVQLYASLPTPVPAHPSTHSSRPSAPLPHLCNIHRACFSSATLLAIKYADLWTCPG